MFQDRDAWEVHDLKKANARLKKAIQSADVDIKHAKGWLVEAAEYKYMAGPPKPRSMTTAVMNARKCTELLNRARNHLADVLEADDVSG